MASTLATQLSALKSEAVSGVGITTVLRDHLRRGKTFRPPRPRAPSAGKKRITQKKGLRIGSWVDRLFTDVIRKKARLNPSDYRHRRCIDLFTGLRRRGVQCVQSQLRVAVPELGIWTSLDALGVQGNAAVVIELKCTQYTLEQHTEVYDRHCTQRRMLANGVLNTERHAHALQTAFGMLALKRALPRVEIKGLVVVCAADGAKMYDVPADFVNSKHFSVAAVRPSFGVYVKNVVFEPLPSRGLPHLREALGRHGYAFTEKDVMKTLKNKYGSFTLATTPKSYLVVALAYTKGPTVNVGEKKRRQLAADAEKLWIDKKKKVKVRACLVHFSSSATPIHQVEFLLKSHSPC